MEFFYFVKFYIGLFVICAPFVAVPALLSLTREHSLEEKRKIGIRSAISVAIILTGVVWIGRPLLAVLDIRIEAFQVSGGLIVLLMALSMLNARISPMKQNPEDRKEAFLKDSIAVVPLAIPLMAGPGAISSAIVFANGAPGAMHQIYASICTILVALSLGICLYFSVFLERLLGVSGMNILSRIGGLVLSAIAIEIMAKGFVGLFPALG